MKRLTPDELLQIIRAKFSELRIETKVSAVPSVADGLGLENRRILLVDDSSEVFRIFAPRLIVATNGQALFIRCAEGSAEQAACRIAEADPEIALVDGQLGGVLRGWDVVKQLRLLTQKLPCLGFSSDPEFEAHFLKQGAFGFVHKEIGKPELTLARLSDQIKLALE